MDPQRKTASGPMAHSSMKAARKSFMVTNTYLKPDTAHKEIITVHTSTPLLERRSAPSEQNQIYTGAVNVLSIIACLCPRESLPHVFVLFASCSPIGTALSTLKWLFDWLYSKILEHIIYDLRDTTKDIMCCKYTEDCNEIAAGFTDGSIRLFDVNTGECTHSLEDDECRSYPGPVTSIKHRPVSKAHPVTNMLLSSYVNGCIKCWKYKYDQCLYTIREKRQTLGLTYHPRNTKFVTYGDDAKLNMYDEEAQTQERAFYSSQRRGIIDGHTSRIFACAFNPKSHHELISGGWDNSIICWDDRQPYATRHFDGVHMCGEGLDFDKPGKQVLTCAWQEKDCIQLWDYGSCKLIETIVSDSYQSKLYCGKIVPQTNLIVVAGSELNMLRVVDINMKTTESSIRNNPGGIYGFDFGTIRRKTKKIETSFKRVSEMEDIPRVAFVTGKRLQTVDFGGVSDAVSKT